MVLHCTSLLRMSCVIGARTLKVFTHEGFCSRSMLQAHFARVSTHEGAFSSSLKFAPVKYCGAFCGVEILLPRMKYTQYTRRSFAPGACPCNMLWEPNPSCVKTLKHGGFGLEARARQRGKSFLFSSMVTYSFFFSLL